MSHCNTIIFTAYTIRQVKGYFLLYRMRKTKTITIGIPTYEAGEHLVTTLQSIYNQSASDCITQILLIVDGGTLQPSLKHKIRHPKLRIVNTPKREGQSSRINDIFCLAHTDLVILTNDDVIWEHTALEALVSAYQEHTADLLCSTMVPLPGTSLLSYYLEPGASMTREIARLWNGGDNYLSCNGRLIALTKHLSENIHLPAHLWNNDAYIYLRTKQLGYRCRFVETARCFYKAPETVQEHIKQTGKFRRSLVENQRYVGDGLSERYHIPFAVQTAALTTTVVQSPLATLGYLVLTAAITIFFFFAPLEDPKVPYWETDPSTKQIERFSGRMNPS